MFLYTFQRIELVIALLLPVLFFGSVAFADVDVLPSRFVDLVDYVQEAPDQGDTVSCLFVASTGAMELLANKKERIKNPEPYGKYDLAESFLITAPKLETAGKYMWEVPVLKFNGGYGIHVNDWPFEAWTRDGYSNMSVWNHRDIRNLPKVELPKVETIPLFVKGNKWSTRILTDGDLRSIKEALVKHKSPILVNYNDDGYWHVVLIVGFDDDLPGTCYQISSEDCGKQEGSFFVRDSFGRRVELRDYEWFKTRGNAAFVVKEKE